MSAHIINIPRYTDAYWIEFFENNEEKFSLSHITCYAISGISANINDERIIILKKSNVYCLRNIAWMCSGLSFSFYRGESASKYGIFDRIEISNNKTNVTDADNIHNFIIYLQEYFKDSCVLPVSSDGTSQISDLYASTISQLQNVNSKLIEFQTEIKKELDEEYKTKKSILHDEYENKENNLILQKEALEHEYTKKQDILTEREALLNDRENVHARRTLRDNIIDRLNSQIHSSQRTFFVNGYTVIILYIFVLAIVGILYLLTTSLYNPLDALRDYKDALKLGEQSASILPFIYTAVKQFLCLSIAIFFLVIFLRWALEQHNSLLEYRKEKNRYLIDIDRANWIVEAALEWKKQNGVEVPEYIIKELLNGIFDSNSKNKNNIDVKHPAEYLFEALMSSKANLKLKLPNGMGEAEVSAKDLANATQKMS